MESITTTLDRVRLWEAQNVFLWTKGECYQWALREISKCHPQPETQIDTRYFNYTGNQLAALTELDFAKFCPAYGRELHMALHDLMRSAGLETSPSTTAAACTNAVQEIYDLDIPDLDTFGEFDQHWWKDIEQLPAVQDNLSGNGAQGSDDFHSLTELHGLNSLPEVKEEVEEEWLRGGGGGAVGGEMCPTSHLASSFASPNPPPYPYSPSSSSSVYSTDASYPTTEGYWPNGDCSNFSFSRSPSSSPQYSTPSPYYDDEERSSSLYSPNADQSWDKFDNVSPSTRTRARTTCQTVPSTRQRNSPQYTSSERSSRGYNNGGDVGVYGGGDPLAHMNTSSRRRSRGPKNWEFIARLLVDSSSNPSLVQWVDEGKYTFKFNRPQQIAIMWGQRSTKKEQLTYDNFARGLRYHYKTGALIPVQERQLVYRCGQKMQEFISALRRG